MRFPFSHTPIFQHQRELGLTTGLHQITEIIAIGGVTPEHIIGVTGVGTFGLHLMVGLRLLFSGLHFVDRTCLQ